MKPATPLLLYIDDDADLARLVERGLKRQGFAVEHAADGANGLARIKQGGIDVVALDQHMPGLDGLETLAEIQKIPDAPPVIFVTAHDQYAIRAFEVAAIDYLPYGVMNARRGWTGPASVANTRSWPQLRTLLKAGKRA